MELSNIRAAFINTTFNLARDSQMRVYITTSLVLILHLQREKKIE